MEAPNQSEMMSNDKVGRKVKGQTPSPPSDRKDGFYFIVYTFAITTLHTKICFLDLFYK